MKTLVGCVLILGGIAAGLYVGLWWAFIGGIVNVIEAIRSEELVAMDVAIGVCKIVFAGIIGWVSAAVLIVPGLALLESDKR
tara:strand:+ start:4640 stop:4885 length:246 start_codon:yes stop_codon:yes gene_type:complete